MRIAVISDVHSNLEALEAVLKKIQEEKPNFLVCAGDFVGYGANPNEVCDILKKRTDLIAVQGNHDYAVVTGDMKILNRISRAAIEWTRKRISQENLEFLKVIGSRFGMQFEGHNVLILHGSPDDALNGYIFEDAPEKELRHYFDESHARIMLVGHTHIPFKKEVDGRYLLNAGSVGQPRGGDSRACYALINLEKKRKPVMEIKRVEYNVEKAAKKIKNSGLPDEIADSLHGGW